MDTQALIGITFGRLTVLASSGFRGSIPMMECRCTCGETRTCNAYHLRSGRSKSCGCARKDTLKRIKAKHGYAPYHGKKPRVYRSWQAMLRRCGKPKDSAYARYGGRGIKVCDRWRDFRNFLADMGEPPPGCSIERIDNNGNYESSNCRWATQKEQCSNQRSNWRVQFGGEQITVAEATRRLGLGQTRIYKALYKSGAMKNTVVTLAWINKQ